MRREHSALHFGSGCLAYTRVVHPVSLGTLTFELGQQPQKMHLHPRANACRCSRRG